MWVLGLANRPKNCLNVVIMCYRETKSTCTQNFYFTYLYHLRATVTPCGMPKEGDVALSGKEEFIHNCAFEPQENDIMVTCVDVGKGMFMIGNTIKEVSSGDKVLVPKGIGFLILEMRIKINIIQ